MSWTDELYKIYEQQCGRAENADDPLLPISHSTANAQIELTITEKGDFVTAERIEKSEAVTVIPVSEDSGARSSGVTPHPFADKLIYIAGDYPQYTQGKRSDNSVHFEEYLDSLRSWALSEYSHPAVKAVLAYISKGILISDLVAVKVLEPNDDGKLDTSLKIAGIAQEDCFVRYRVLYLSDIEPRTWLDASLYNAYISFNSTRMGEKQLCYALGAELPVTYKHPSKLRNAGDKAKLISTNDESSFTYRGRFDDKEQAISVSYEFSQKMHNALKWLVQRQGLHIPPLTIVVWESALSPVPDVTKDINSLFADFGIDDVSDTEEIYGDNLVAAYKEMLQKTIFGHAVKLSPDSKTMILMLDSATTGRLSMSQYSELASTEFYENLKKWHYEAAWQRFNGYKKRREINSFSLKEIAECAYGSEQDNSIECKSELKRDIVLRLIPCVTEARSFPQDIVNALVTKACNPLAYHHEYNWRKVLEAACGLLRKKICETEEDCTMALDHECTNRDYLFGRLLAVADVAERSTYDDGDKERITNARRYFNAFANRPSSGWQTIYSRLDPYFNRMNEGSRIRYTKLINEITSMFQRDDFSDNSKLRPEFLHAYSCQINELYTPKDTTDNKED